MPQTEDDQDYRMKFTRDVNNTTVDDTCGRYNTFSILLVSEMSSLLLGRGFGHPPPNGANNE